MVESKCILVTSNQSYKHFMLIIYDSRGVLLSIFLVTMTLPIVVNYEHKVFIRLTKD